MRILDLTGKTFGRWIVIRRAPNQGRHVQWLCRCECGTTISISSTNLITGRSTSCGCLHTERITTHGNTGSPEYKTWVAMKSRCYTPTDYGFRFYGGRGITVCDRWLHSFENFLADMGKRPGPEYSIDRIDTYGNYCPENCRWASKDTQGNNRRDNRFITFEGKTQTVAQWAREKGFGRSTLLNRLQWGWPIEEALTWPSKRGRVNPSHVKPV